jgi:hypothetical protein
MSKHSISTSIKTALTRDLTDVEGKLVAGLGTSVTLTSVTEALKFIGVVHYPSWVPIGIAIAAYFVGGYLKRSTIGTVEPTDSPATAAAEVAASTVGSDLAEGNPDAALHDLVSGAFAAAGLPATPAPVAAPISTDSSVGVATTPAV